MERVGGHGPEAAAVRTVLQQRTPENISALTPRELEILTLLPSHLSLRQVAEDLQLSVNTVKTHVRILYSKLGVTNRHDAVEAAFRHGHVA
nr:LuxR C-terminal-related transcriptional regulator [Arthrobacter zhangbolii]